MRNRLVIVTTVLGLLPTLAYAGSCGKHEPALREAKLELWPRFYRESDAKGLADFLAPGFIAIAADGSISSREEELLWVANNVWNPIDFEYRISRIHCPSADTAVVVGEGRSIHAAKDGRRTENRYTSSNLFVLKDGRWRAAFSHISGERSMPLGR